MLWCIWQATQTLYWSVNMSCCYVKLLDKQNLAAKYYLFLISKFKHVMCPECTLRGVIRVIGYFGLESGHKQDFVCSAWALQRKPAETFTLLDWCGNGQLCFLNHPVGRDLSQDSKGRLHDTLAIGITPHWNCGYLNGTSLNILCWKNIEKKMMVIRKGG